MNYLEIEFGVYAAYISFAVCLLIAIKYPAGIIFSFLTTKAFAWAPMFGFTNYARVLFSVQLLVVIWLFVEAVRTGGLVRIFNYVRTRNSMLVWFLLVVWFKIFVDVLIGGLNPDRVVAIKTAPVQVFFPAFVIVLSLAAYSLPRVLVSLIVGMLAFSLVCVCTALPFVLEGKRIMLALQGSERLTIWGVNTIWAGEIFTYAALGALSVGLVARGVWSWIKPLAWTLFAAAFFLLILNATRQYLLTCSLAAVLVVALGFRKNFKMALVFLTFILVAFSYFAGMATDAATVQRISGDALSGEVEQSRGVIWKNAFRAGVSSPLFGEGFRNFGEVVSTVSDLTGEVQAKRDTAHGFFQDIWAEHGMMLGILGVVIMIGTQISIVKAWLFSGDVFLGCVVLLSVSLLVTCLFSGSVFMSQAPYIVAALSFGVRGLGYGSVNSTNLGVQGGAKA
jgi:O-Antigen ligase